MNNTVIKNTILSRADPERIYTNSVIRCATNFWHVQTSISVLDLADELQNNPDIQVVGVSTNEKKYAGFILRDKLFSLVGKPFGRDILQRCSVEEIMEQSCSYNVHTDMFTMAEEVLNNKMATGTEYYPLTDSNGMFKGIVSSRDISDYLSGITREDIQLAARLQERLIHGRELLRGETWKAEAWTRAAKGVGGDFYFSKELPDGKQFFALCDVSGKGVAASLIVSMAWGMLRMFDYTYGLKKMLAHLNTALVETFHMEKYLTGVFLLFDPGSGKILFADMGHSHLFMMRGNKAYTLKTESTNLPVGIEYSVEPHIQTCKLKEGDKLVIYSDGITEQENPDGEEYGETRLLRTLAREQKKQLRTTEAVAEDIDQFRSTVPQQDDMSLFILSV